MDHQNGDSDDTSEEQDKNTGAHLIAALFAIVGSIIGFGYNAIAGSVLAILGTAIAFYLALSRRRVSGMPSWSETSESYERSLRERTERGPTR